MAVEDKYVNSVNFDASGNLLHLANAINCSGSKVGAMFETVELAAADSDGSVYRFFKGVDANLIPLFIIPACDEITAGTVFDIGLYEPNLGVVVNAAVFASNLDFSSAKSFALATCLDGMAAVAIENRGKRIFEHAGHSVTAGTRLSSYDICVTGDTVGSAAGTVSLMMIYAIG